MISRIYKRIFRETIIESKLIISEKAEASLFENRIDKIARNFLNLIEKENKESIFFAEKVILPKIADYFKVPKFSDDDLQTFKNINKISLLFSISHSIGSKVVILYVDYIFKKLVN